MNFSSPFFLRGVVVFKLLLKVLLTVTLCFVMVICFLTEDLFAKEKHHDAQVVAISTWTVVVHEDLTDGYHTYRLYSVYSRLSGNRLSTFSSMEAAEAFIDVFTPNTTHFPLRNSHEPSRIRTRGVP